MRAFQPIAPRMEAARNRNPWTPPPVLRRIARCVLLAVTAFQLVLFWRMLVYLLAVQNNPAYALTHKWPGSPLQSVALGVMLSCMPFLCVRGAQPKKHPVPDPALSILPR